MLNVEFENLSPAVQFALALLASGGGEKFIIHSDISLTIPPASEVLTILKEHNEPHIGDYARVMTALDAINKGGA